MTARNVTCLTCFAAIVLICSTASIAGIRTLSWDASAGASGYHVHYGDNPRTYVDTFDAGNTTTFTLPVNLDDCTRWYFAVTAYNTAGESGYSDEVSWLTPMAVEDVTPASASDSLEQGSLFPVTVQGARFMGGATLQLEYTPPGPESVCPAELSTVDCRTYYEDRLADTVRFQNPSVSCNKIDLMATIEPVTAGARAAATGSYTLTVTNPDGSSASGEFEIALNPVRRELDTSTIYTDGRVDGLDFPHIAVRLPSSCHEAVCPQYDDYVDINGDGWIDGKDLPEVGGNYFFVCWDDAIGDWSAAACRTHSSELSPEIPLGGGR